MTPAHLEAILPLSRFLARLVESRPEIGDALRADLQTPWTAEAVSYTHLTLPTSDLV